MTLFTHEHSMQQALQEAQKAADEQEIPVGAIVKSHGKILARTHNQTEKLNDVTAHAEMLAITAATHYLGGKYLQDCAFYVTLEPCPMCAGALYWARPSLLIIGAADPERGYKRISDKLLHPRTAIIEGVKAIEASEMLKEFFRHKRQR